MSQDPSPTTLTSPSLGPPLEDFGHTNAMQIIVSTLLKHPRSRPQKQQKSISQTYAQINKLLEQLDTNISSCKKYNMARIQRLYQTQISSLQQQLSKQRTKTKVLQTGKLQGSSCIDQLVQQLVHYKQENQELRREVQELRGKVQEGVQQASCKVPQNSSVKNGVLMYLKQEQFQRRLREEMRSQFQEFLKKKLTVMEGWGVVDLLGEIGKWVRMGGNGANFKRPNLRLPLPSFSPQKLPKLSDPIIPSSKVLPPNITSSRSTHLPPRARARDRHSVSTIGAFSHFQQPQCLLR